jgi:protein-disulfide isomerase
MQNSKPSKFNINTLLVVVLIVGAYFLGSLQTKVQMLEKGAQAPTEQAANGNPSDTVPAAAPPAQAAIKKPELTADDHIKGNKNAKVILVEYSDMECPFCKRFHPTMQQIFSDYSDKVQWVYRHYPLSFHANAQKEAEASECAAKLGGNDAFWKYTDAVYERTAGNGTGFALDKLVPLAKEIGLSESQFKTCLDSGEFAQRVKDHMAQGSAEGVTGTPGTILIEANGDTQLISGALPYEQIKPMIEKALSS